MLEIHAYLPKDRARRGALHLLNSAGALLAARIDCLGKADNQRAAAAGNPSRDPVRPYGDTPAGTYKAARVVKLDPPHPRLGALMIPLEGLTGDALRAAEQGRTGLAIHGGRGDDRLVPTYGCLRLRDRDMAKLAELIGDEQIAVTVEDVA